MDYNNSGDSIDDLETSNLHTITDTDRTIKQKTVSHWPLNLNFYSRDKKLIRDVSGNSRKMKDSPEHRGKFATGIAVKRVTNTDG